MDKYSKLVTSAAVVALSPSVAISWWSLNTLMTNSHAPLAIAAVTSAGIDGVAIVAGATAHEAAAQGHSSRFARGVLYVLTGLSTLVNWEHGSTAHWNFATRILVAAMPGVAALAFEIIMQRAKRIEEEAREPRVRTRRAVKIDLDVWLRQLKNVWKRRQAEALQRLNEVMPADQRKYDTVRDAVSAHSGTITAHVGTLVALVAHLQPLIEQDMRRSVPASTIEREARRIRKENGVK